MSEFVGYEILAYWGPRRETPAELGQRFWKMLQALGTANPAFSGWKFIGLTKFWPLPTGPGDELSRLIADCVDTVTMATQPLSMAIALAPALARTRKR